MVSELIESYLVSNEREIAERSAAAKRADECEAEAARIMERAAARVKKKMDEAEHIRKELERQSVASWVDAVVKPIADALSEATGLYNTVIGPFGICSQVIISLHKEPEYMPLRQERKEITLQPCFCESGLTILYETGERTERFVKGTIGEVNGMNNVTAPLPDGMDEILALMREVPSLRRLLGLESEG